MFDLLVKNLSWKAIKGFLTVDNVTHHLSQLLLLIFIWSVLYGVSPEAAKPTKGHIFQMVVIFGLSFTAGEVMTVFNLPPLLGMLFTGFIVANVFDLNLDKKWAATSRQTALVIILMRAGLELNPTKIMRLSGLCFRLSFSPCIAETTAIAISAHFILDMSFKWSFLMGFVLAAVSPAVVVAGILPLKEKGYGVDKGIPTILMAASSIDDVLAITGAMICIRLVFDSNSPLIWVLVKGPIEALIGVMSGILIGIILWFIPTDRESQPGDKPRLTLLFMSALAVKYVSAHIDIESAGPLNSLVTSFTAALAWRPKRIHKPIQKYLKVFWSVFQPLLFGLIGTEVKIEALKSSQITLAVICLFIGLTVRSVTAMAVVYGAHFTLKEKLFVAIAWLPKATVQAALGPIALDIARTRNDEKNIENAKLVLTIAVLSIMITAPLGGIGVALCGPKLLTARDGSESTNAREENEDDDDDDDD